MLDPVISDLNRHLRYEADLDAAEARREEHAEEVAATLLADRAAFNEASDDARILPIPTLMLPEDAVWALLHGDVQTAQAKAQEFYEALCKHTTERAYAHPRLPSPLPPREAAAPGA